jgi:hypothetical protein
METLDDYDLVLHRILPHARPPVTHTRRPARAASMLALAYQIDEAIADGLFASASDAAQLLGVSRERASRLLRLLTLAPDIQEEVLFLEAIDDREPVCIKWVTDVVARELAWRDQRRVWREGQRRRRRSPTLRW